MATILCVDDEPAALLILRTALDQAGHRCIAVTNVDAALNVLARGPVDLIIAGGRTPELTGEEFTRRLVDAGHETPLVVSTADVDIERAPGRPQAIGRPIRADQVARVVEQALEFARLRRENAALRLEVRQLRSDHRIIGESPALLRIMELVRTVAPTRAAVLLHGESGTGKDLIARTIHDLSDRTEGPFVSANCAALPDGMAESTLFGHEAGVVRGASRLVRGALERAHRGTLLLDHVAELPAPLQARLLAALQEQEFERVGGGTPVRVDLRIISTSIVDLAEATKQGRFREDLFFRLGVVPVHVPPLRTRPEDVPVLARHFAARTAREIGRGFNGFTAAAIDRLCAYAWPGNVRELAHAVERAVIMSPTATLDEDAFDAAVPRAAVARAFIAGAASPRPAGPMVVLSTLDIGEAEAALISRALELTHNNRTRAAELLGISVRTLRNKLNRELASGKD